MLTPDDLDMLARMIAETREKEIGCHECLEQLDRYVEMRLSGMDTAAAMPLVEDHLEKCGDCREEFEMLLEALRAADGSGPVGSLWARLRRTFGVR